MKAVIISDTHMRHYELDIPDGDIIIHSGDFSYNNASAHNFLSWFSSLDFKYKILVAGNHDATFEEFGKEKVKKMCEIHDERIIYLEDESVEIEGIKFYGSPWTVLYRNWHFMKEEEDLIPEWEKIPLDTEILITHGPQYETLDKLINMGHIDYLGSRSLEEKMQQLKKLKMHIFGHIHGGAGIVEPTEFKNYVSVNASVLYEYNQDTTRLRDPIVINL